MADEVCAVCGGSGWKIIEKDGLSGAQRCECVLKERGQALLRRARIPTNYANDSFENFSNRGSDDLNHVLLTLSGYCKEFPNVDPPGLLFTGETGTGKTHLAVAVLKRLIEHGFEGGLFFDYQNLLERIRSGYDPLSGESPREAYEEALEAKILVLDDLGAHRVTDWVEDTVTSVITYRYNARMPTIVTTNVPDADVGDSLIERPASGSGAHHRLKRSLPEMIGLRARSRLFEMCRIIRMPRIGDYRVEKKVIRRESSH